MNHGVRETQSLLVRYPDRAPNTAWEKEENIVQMLFISEKKHLAPEALNARAELTYGGTVCVSKDASKCVPLTQESSEA